MLIVYPFDLRVLVPARTADNNRILLIFLYPVLKAGSQGLEVVLGDFELKADVDEFDKVVIKEYHAVFLRWRNGAKPSVESPNAISHAPEKNL